MVLVQKQTSTPMVRIEKLDGIPHNDRYISLKKVPTMQIEVKITIDI